MDFELLMLMLAHEQFGGFYALAILRPRGTSSSRGSTSRSCAPGRTSTRTRWLFVSVAATLCAAVKAETSDYSVCESHTERLVRLILCIQITIPVAVF